MATELNYVMIRFGASLKLTDEQLIQFKEDPEAVIQEALATDGIMFNEDSYIPENDELDIEECNVASLGIRIFNKEQ